MGEMTRNFAPPLTAAPPTATERTSSGLEIAAHAFAIVRDGLLIVFMVAALLVGIRVAGAIGDAAKAVTSTNTSAGVDDQPCLLNPGAEGCGG